MKSARNRCDRPKSHLTKKPRQNREDDIWEAMILVRRMDMTGRRPDMVQNVFGIREAKSGTETDELLQSWNRRAPKNLAKC